MHLKQPPDFRILQIHHLAAVIYNQMVMVCRSNVINLPMLYTAATVTTGRVRRTSETIESTEACPSEARARYTAILWLVTFNPDARNLPPMSSMLSLSSIKI